MDRNVLFIWFLLLSFSGFAQMREIKPEAEQFGPEHLYFFPQYEILFPDSMELQEAISFYENQIENINGMTGEYNQPKILFCISELNRLKGNSEKALFILLEAYNFVKSELNDHNQARLQSRLLFNSITVMRKHGDKSTLAFVYQESGYSGWEEMIDTNIRIFSGLDDEKSLLALYRTAFEFYQLEGDIKKAYKYGEDWISYRKFVADQQLKRQLSELKDVYQMAQKERDIQLLNNQKRILQEKIVTHNRQQWAIIIGVSLLLILSLLLFNRVRIMRRTRDLLEAKASQYQHEKNRAEKNELFKEQFLANVSHEIRTPMNAIMGITNILIRNKHPESQNKYLTAMHESARILLVLINDILDLSKLGAGKLELINTPFNPREIVATVRKELEKKANDKGLKYFSEVNDNLPEYLLGDGPVLTNILMSLMNNAISFTAEGSVSLSCRAGVVVDTQVPVIFEVKDTGMGIIPEKQEMILKTFVKVYDNKTIQYQGSGLELAIINQTVELQGGQVRLESQPGEGTHIFVEIPYVLTDSNLVIEPEMNMPDTRISDVAILLVEDNEFNVMVASTELESVIDGLRLDVAGNGSIALDKMKNNQYDIVLMDVQMPVMDGYEATRRIRRMNDEKGNIPIIAMTANVLQLEVQKCLKEGMNDYISKPFETDELLLKITKLLSSRS